MIEPPRPKPAFDDFAPMAMGPKTRILALGILLAGLGYLAFFHDSSEDPFDPTEQTLISATTEVETPSLDRDLLGSVRDTTRDERLILEPQPLTHLLDTARNVSPAVAQALGMPREPLSVDSLRARPGEFRGKYLWFKGRLDKLEGPAKRNPSDGYSVWTAHIETDSGDRLIHYFTTEPLNVRVGEWVRAEGFFLKLRDLTFPIQLERAPVLVGKKLTEDFDDWSEVRELDEELMGSIVDGRWLPSDESGGGGDAWVPLGISTNTLLEDQGMPLWHLAAYAKTHSAGTTEEWRTHPALNLDFWPTVHKDDNLVPRGTPMRILGTFISGRRFRAPPNPAGIEYWTEVLIQVHDLGGKLIPIWVAADIGDWALLEPVEARGFFFKRYTYPAKFRNHGVIAPVFVAARLDRYSATKHPVLETMGWVFFGAAILVILTFILVARRDRSSSTAFEAERLARRQRRRSRHPLPRVTPASQLPPGRDA